MKRALLFGISAGIVIALAYLAGLLELPEGRTLDLRFDLRGPKAPAFPIVLVTADDDSLAEMDRQWPWPRSYHARVIDQIAKDSPLAIGVDILFAEKTQDREDRLLGHAVAGARRVVLGETLRNIATQTSQGVTQQREIVEPPLPAIRAGAAGVGFVELERGKDAVVRSVVLARRHAGEVHLSSRVSAVRPDGQNARGRPEPCGTPPEDLDQLPGPQRDVSHLSLLSSLPRGSPARDVQG